MTRVGRQTYISGRRFWRPPGLRLRGAAAAFAAILLASGVVQDTSARVNLVGNPVCGFSTGSQPSVSKHVIWIWMENQSYNSMMGAPGSPAYESSPFLNGLAAQCGVATNYHNVTHPSLPNYLAATSGQTGGVTDDCFPGQCPQGEPSLFGLLASEGHTWMSFEESMPSNCDGTNTDLYAPVVNPAAYYSDASRLCATDDVPLGSTSGGPFVTALRVGLPNFTLIIPNYCDDTHNCPTSAGDAWLAAWLPAITSSLEYRNGSTTVFITWDEGDGGSYTAGEDCSTSPADESCHIPALVVSPYVTPGTVSSTLFTHYSLLKTTEQLLGVSPLLGVAADSATAAMASAFNLANAPAQTWNVVLLHKSTLRAVNAALQLARKQLEHVRLRPVAQHSATGYVLTLTGFPTALAANRALGLAARMFPLAKVTLATAP
jgi:phospholipase C